MNEEFEHTALIAVSNLEHDCLIVEHYELNRTIRVVTGDLFKNISRHIVSQLFWQLSELLVIADKTRGILQLLLRS
jgi:hypothetical protein